ncbi:MAG: phosphoribosylamine--glycine ligase, partial [Thermodesulfovibrionales bacterium]|nr:phosphoribosylamine--glycine ligase [Thermodesulfovibrionales bacterium]
QPILSRLNSDLFEISLAITESKLNEIDVKWSNKSSVCVVLASDGYPGKYEKGKKIEGLDKVKKLKDTFVFHAGTDFNGNDIVTNGGRVLGVTALGENIVDAQKRAYEAVKMISFSGMHYRKDIAGRAIKRV